MRRTALLSALLAVVLTACGVGQYGVAVDTPDGKHFHGDVNVAEVGATASVAPATATTVPATATSVPPTATTAPPTPTSVPPTAAPTPTSVPPTAAPTSLTALPSGSYLEPMTGAPSAPVAFTALDLLTETYVRDNYNHNATEPMVAGHGSDCGAPPASHTTTGTIPETIYQCKDHVMTALSAESWGIAQLTPLAQMDWSTGESVLSWDVSTLRTSSRDWLDIWITPLADVMPFPDGQFAASDLSGTPRNALELQMSGGANRFSLLRHENGAHTEVQGIYQDGYETWLTPSATVREHFELRLGANGHVQFGMPAYNRWWANTVLPNPLPFTRAVVQFGHVSYNPTKDNSGTANTWHWDNIAISQTAPLTAIRSTPRVCGPGPCSYTLERPAPANGSLRFLAWGKLPEVSFNGGASWTAVPEQTGSKAGFAQAYLCPIPVGQTSVMLRGQTNDPVPFAAQGVMVVAE